MSPCWDLLKLKHVTGSCPVCNQPPWAPSLLALSAGELTQLTQLRPVTSTELPRAWPCFESPHLFLRDCILHPCSSQCSRAEGTPVGNAPPYTLHTHEPPTHDLHNSGAATQLLTPRGAMSPARGTAQASLPRHHCPWGTASSPAPGAQPASLERQP